MWTAFSTHCAPPYSFSNYLYGKPTRVAPDHSRKWPLHVEGVSKFCRCRLYRNRTSVRQVGCRVRWLSATLFRRLEVDAADRSASDPIPGWRLQDRALRFEFRD